MTSVSVLRLGAGAEFRTISPGGFRILAALDHATQVIGKDIWITAGTNDHTSGRHPKGEAVDVSVRGFDVPTIKRLKEVLSSSLGPRFTVLYETPVRPEDPMLAAIAYVNPDATGPHIHAQVRRDTEYPPTAGS